MIVENGIIKISQKGIDVAMSMMGKANKIKDKLTKPTSMAIKYLTEKGGAEKSEAIANQRLREESRLTRGIKNTSSAFNDLSSSVGGANASGFISGVAGIAGQFGGAYGQIGSAIAQGMNSIISGSIATVKNAVSSTVTNLERQTRLGFYGGGIFTQERFAGSNIHAGGKGKKQINLSQAEQSQLVESVAGRYGKIGNALATQIDKIISHGKDFQQVLNVSTGNFKALGTDKGYFMQQIADSLGGLPPSMAQEMQSQLMGSLDMSEFADDMAAKSRHAVMVFDQTERDTNLKMANNANLINEANKSMAELSVSLAEAGASVTNTLWDVGKALKKAATFLQFNAVGYETKGKQK